METTKCYVHDIILLLLCLIMSPEFIIPAKAQPGTSQASANPFSALTPSLAIIVGVLMLLIFFMLFFAIYFRRCSDATFPTRGVSAMSRGLDRSIIDTLPIFSYSEVKEHKIANGVLECAICLNEFEDDDKLRLIPKCDHVFHPVCIDAWLASHDTCAVCRASLVLESGDEPIHVHHGLINRDNVGERSNEIVLQIEDENQCQERNVLTRSCSSRQKTIGVGMFRSHSTGHSLVQQRDQNLERFTLRLSSEVRTVMINRASLNQVTGQPIMMTGVASSKKGYKPETRGEGSSNTGRSDRDIRSDKWGFLTRALSMNTPKVRVKSKQDEIKTPAKMNSFKSSGEKKPVIP